LTGDDPAGGKATALPDGLDIIDNRLCRITWAQKIAVHGVSDKRRVNRTLGSCQSLRQYLATENPARPRWAEALKL